MRRWIILVFPLVLLAGCDQPGIDIGSPQQRQKPVVDIQVTTSSPSQAAALQSVLVTRVIDGDTIEIETGQRVRLIGIDTPETVHPSQPVGCFGREASQKTTELLHSQLVELEKDISETDRYGRLLRYVWLEGVLINELLVREGYAQVTTYPPDVKYEQRFLEAQRQARDAGAGLWGEICDTAHDPISTPDQPSLLPTTDQVSGQQYSCSCSKTCSQINSCEEAYFQLNQCGCSRRDGDGDGVPCETLCAGG